MDELSPQTPDEKLRLVLSEMRNPLTTISLASRYLSETIKHDGEYPVKRFTDMVELIQRNVEKLEGAIKSLLDSSHSSDPSYLDNPGPDTQ